MRVACTAVYLFLFLNRSCNVTPPAFLGNSVLFLIQPKRFRGELLGEELADDDDDDDPDAPVAASQNFGYSFSITGFEEPSDDSDESDPLGPLADG